MNAPVEPARIREHGTTIHVAKTADEFIAGCRDVLANGYAKINDELMDATTAGAMVAVWDALNEKNRAITRNYYERWLIKGGERVALRACVGLFWKFVK